MGMSVFVTGASGFVGRHLLSRLLDEGHNVIAYDLKPPVSPNYSGRHTHIITGDLSSGEGLEQIVWEEVDAVVHLAAAGVKASQRNWSECVSVNIVGTEQLLHAMSQVSPTPLLVYPRTFYEDYLNEISGLEKNPYIVTKTAATKIVELWASDNKNANVVFGSIFQAYGAGDDPGNILTYTTNCLKNGVAAELGCGNTLRDWIYIDDLVDAFTRALKINGNKIQYFDFGTGQLTSIKQVVVKLAGLMGCSNDLLSFDSKRNRDDTELISYAKKFLPGWKPQVSLEEGIINYLNSLEI